MAPPAAAPAKPPTRSLRTGTDVVCGIVFLLVGLATLGYFGYFFLTDLAPTIQVVLDAFSLGLWDNSFILYCLVLISYVLAILAGLLLTLGGIFSLVSGKGRKPAYAAIVLMLFTILSDIISLWLMTSWQLIPSFVDGLLASWGVYAIEVVFVLLITILLPFKKVAKNRRKREILLASPAPANPVAPPAAAPATAPATAPSTAPAEMAAAPMPSAAVAAPAGKAALKAAKTQASAEKAAAKAAEKQAKADAKAAKAAQKTASAQHGAVRAAEKQAKAETRVDKAAQKQAAVQEQAPPPTAAPLDVPLGQVEGQGQADEKAAKLAQKTAAAEQDAIKATEKQLQAESRVQSAAEKQEKAEQAAEKAAAKAAQLQEKAEKAASAAAELAAPMPAPPDDAT